jgi:hypothetical protein
MFLASQEGLCSMELVSLSLNKSNVTEKTCLDTLF